MRLIITLLITIHICINNLVGQVNIDSLLFNCELKIYQATSVQEKNKHLFEKANIYINNLNYTGLNQELNRIHWQDEHDTLLLKKFFWNKAISEFFNTKYNIALNEINHLKDLQGTNTSSSEQLLEILILLNIDSVSANAAIKRFSQNDSTINGLNCFFQTINYEKKRAFIYTISSALVPGSGMLMLNSFFKGSAALTINALSVFAVYSLLQNNLYFNSIIWGIVLAQKFYIGNIKLTKKVFSEKEKEEQMKISEQCKLNTLKLLNDYKISFITF